MITKLQSLLITFAVIITGLIICGIRIYNMGVEKEHNKCEQEKQIILIGHANTVEQIIKENNKKTDVQRRKDLERYVIK